MAGVSILDSSTITLFVDIFKGAGRNAIDGKKKGGLKLNSQVPISGFVPSLVYLTEAACNDKVFFGQPVTQPRDINVFDKGYVNYQVWSEWKERGVFYAKG